MSETEHNRGTLIPIITVKDVETTAEIILKNLGQDRHEKLTARQQLEDFGHEKYHVTDDRIYLIKYESLDPYGDIMEAKRNSQGYIDFDVRYYNGGCCLSEALDIALGNMLTREADAVLSEGD